jgi:DDE superfamily endonuclease
MVLPALPGFMLKNLNGGTYSPGRMYSIEKKADVKEAYLELILEIYPLRPSYRALAKRAKVSLNYAMKVAREIDANGDISDPNVIREENRLAIVRRGPGSKTLSVTHEIFLLSLRSENPSRPLGSYVFELYTTHGVRVSESTISSWFLKRFKHRGSFRKPNLIPLDKYRLDNVARFMEFMDTKRMIVDHRGFNFVDEKHIVNKDTVPNKVRACPLTGRVDTIAVSGDFREAYSIIAVISANPTKPKPIAYTIGKENGNANAFLSFIELMISSRFFKHDEALIMDNAAIHTGGAAGIIEDLLWNHVVDGRPLRILTIYLPTRSPELNPIELVFHILARRSRDWRLYGNFEGRSIVKNASKVMDEMSYDLIKSCCIHCGYNL